MLNVLCGLLMRFRLNNIAIVAGIEKSVPSNRFTARSERCNTVYLAKGLHKS